MVTLQLSFQRWKKLFAATVVLAVIGSTAAPAYSTQASDHGTEITLIHMGDVHGHLVPRPNVRSDGKGRMEGGLARMFTKIKTIREAHKDSLLINTGDTVQGSAEALYTRGQALVDVLNEFKIDAFAPGNWEFVYGTERFLELFGPMNPKAPWSTLAANVYYDGEPYADKTGQRVLPPYIIKHVGGLKVGILGFTTDRGPQVVGSAVTKGFKFTSGDLEMAELVPVLRNQEKVDLLVVASELGLANNIRLAEANPGIDVILSSDMHEETREPVLTKTGTIIVEEGQDGTMLGELRLHVKDRKVKNWHWNAHAIDSTIRDDKEIAGKIAEIRKTFVSGPDFVQHLNPFNGTKLQRPIDTVVGYTKKDLHRSNFAQEDMPGVIEGSSHDFLTDAFRSVAVSDIGAIRGFRYGTHVKAGPIKYEDLFHYIAIGPMIAKGTIKGQSLKNQIENAADGSLNPDVAQWTGGWLFGFSGVTMDFDPYAPKGSRASNIKVLKNGVWTPLDPAATYTYASYYYLTDPTLINRVPAANIQVLRDENGNVLDGTEVVVRYLQSLPNQTADPELNRIRLVKPLPPYRYGVPEVQPLQGANSN